MFCMNDNVPLIASFKSNITCAYNASCMKIARLQCPCDGCKVALCYQHLSEVDKEAQRTGQKMYVEVDDTNVSDMTDVTNHDLDIDGIENDATSILDADDNSLYNHESVSCEDHDLHSDLSVHSEISKLDSWGIGGRTNGGRGGINPNIQCSNTRDSFDYGNDAYSDLSVHSQRSELDTGGI